jgi:hypothetical protein
LSQIPEVIDFTVADDSCSSAVSQNWLMPAVNVDNRQSGMSKNGAVESMNPAVIRPAMRQSIQHAIDCICVLNSETSGYAAHK